jgi:hypothetical protein
LLFWWLNQLYFLGQSPTPTLTLAAKPRDRAPSQQLEAVSFEYNVTPPRSATAFTTTDQQESACWLTLEIPPNAAFGNTSQTTTENLSVTVDRKRSRSQQSERLTQQNSVERTSE